MTDSIEGKCKVVLCDPDVNINGIRQFDCGEKMLNDYLKQLKRQCGQENINALLLLDGSDKLRGFVTASLYQLRKEAVPKDSFPYSLPPVFAVMKIPMFAIDKPFQRQGWGKEMMRAILDYILDCAAKVKGIKGVLLDAKIEAKSFYEQLDFQAISDEVSEHGTIPMFLSIDTLRQSKSLTQSA